MPMLHRVFLCCFVCLAEIVLLLTIRVPYAIADSGTHLSGGIGANTTWTATSSPYILDADVEVPSGGLLTVTPGTRITGPGKIVLTSATLRMNGARLDGGAVISAVDSDLAVSSTTFFAGSGDAVHIEGGHIDARRDRFERNAGAGIYVADSVRSSGGAGVYDSVFKENGSTIVSKTLIPVEAQNDWWGQDTGPRFGGHNGIVGKVAYSPWLTEEPDRLCCSSVLFIPGLEGTRLYDGTEKVWEPMGDTDVRKLFLNADGTSIRQISTGEVIGSAYGLAGIYGAFLTFLNSMVADGSIADARVYGYDWRKPVDEVAGPALEAALSDLAVASKTGRVTIIAHSNGGLVAKSLVERLAREGRADLVDKVISIAVPFAGAPASIAALLHGDGQSILGGLLMSASAARGLARNMPSAYTLLPSSAHATATPFVSGTHTAVDHAGLWDFLKSRLNQLLLASADVIHSVIDPFAWPQSVVHVALAGWNVLTSTGVHYFDRIDCRLALLRRICKVAEAHTIDTTSKGDGTVLTSSAAYGAGQVASLDLDTISQEEGTAFDHANMLESQSIQKVIRHIVSDKPLETLSVDGFLLAGQPGPERTYTKITVAGNVDMHVSDAATHSAVGTKKVFNDEAGTTTSIYIPATAGARYSVALTGSGAGYAMVSAQQVQGSSISNVQTYNPILVLPGSTASTTLDDGLTDAPPVSVDLDNDGTPDSTASSTPATASSTAATAIGVEDLATTTVDTLRAVLCK